MSRTIKIVLSTVIITLGLITLVLYFSGSIFDLIEGSFVSESPVAVEGTPPSTKVIYKVIDRDEETNIRVYKAVSRGVVNITSEVMGFFSRLEPSSKGSGSGCVLDKKGHIITNYHVIEGSNRWVVTLGSGKKYLSSLVGVDSENDLAVLKIDAKPSELYPIKISRSLSNLEVGQKVLAIGNPFGLERTLTDGIISSLGRMLKTPSGGYINDVIQTDAAINPGNSGGPLLNTKGELIGINTLILSPSGGSVGIGFAVPSSIVVLVKNDLIRYGSRPVLGIESYPLSWYPGLSKYLGLSISEGAVIFKVKKGYAGEGAGLRGYTKLMYSRFYFDRIPIGGDIIVSIDGKSVSHPRDIIRIMSKKTFGDNVSLGIIRSGKSISVKIVLKPPSK